MEKRRNSRHSKMVGVKKPSVRGWWSSFSIVEWGQKWNFSGHQSVTAHESREHLNNNAGWQPPLYLRRRKPMHAQSSAKSPTVAGRRLEQFDARSCVSGGECNWGKVLPCMCQTHLEGARLSLRFGMPGWTGNWERKHQLLTPTRLTELCTQMEQQWSVTWLGWVEAGERSLGVREHGSTFGWLLIH